ncbi:AP-3 complex subunit beta-1 [Microtus ochrogaster]|uniref:AP-3 complex subunit beta-1 n=1 Tax=Microtus ochrogaster TaxID=79684 RepID=A0A8J6H103_MICOH|nr:AP-3 complex subunit beta-1 [Microtus ochrogaster]
MGMSGHLIFRPVGCTNTAACLEAQLLQFKFAAKTVHSGSLMLVTVELKEGSTAQLIINTEKTLIGSVLLRELKPVLSQG